MPVSTNSQLWFKKLTANAVFPTVSSSLNSDSFDIVLPEEVVLRGFLAGQSADYSTKYVKFNYSLIIPERWRCTFMPVITREDQGISCYSYCRLYLSRNFELAFRNLRNFDITLPKNLLVGYLLCIEMQ